MNTTAVSSPSQIRGIPPAVRRVASRHRRALLALQTKFVGCADDAIVQVKFTRRARHQASRILGPETYLIDLLAARPGAQVLSRRWPAVFRGSFGSALNEISVILLLLGLAGCGGGGPSAPPPPIDVSVSPSSAIVPVGQAKQFTVTVSGTSNTSVTWQINGVTGGNATIGMISPSGLYVGPTAVPGPPTVTVTAVSLADANKSGAASILVTVPVAVTVGSTVNGRVQTFMSTNFQPADTFRAAFFTRAPNAAALVGNLLSQHIRILGIKDAIPQKSPTAWDFSLLDPIVTQLLNTGDQSPEFEIAQAPGFMTDSNGNLLLANFQAFANYSANLVKYYNAGGFDVNGTHFQSPSPKHITWWSVYNEPNFPFTPDQYVTLYNLVVPAMKAVDPTIKIVAVQLGDLGGSGRNDWPQVFMPTFVSHVTAPVDAVATHLYSTCDQRDSDQVLFDSVGQFVDHVKFIASSLKANASLANVPVWVTENNINASFSGEGGVAGFTTCNGVMFPYVEDLRGSSAFFAAWRPLVFSRLSQAGAQAFYHWFFPAGPQYGEYDDNYPPGTEKLLLSYWVDYHLARYFPSPPGSDIFQLSTTDATTVETLATRNPDGSVVVMVVDHAAHSPTDDNGAGDPRLVTVDLTALGRFNSATLLTIDASTDPVIGPTAAAVMPAAQMQVSLAGYGVSFLKLKP